MFVSPKGSKKIEKNSNLKRNFKMNLSGKTKFAFDAFNTLFSTRLVCKIREYANT